MTDQELLALDQIGFIPGPKEEEEAFLARVQKTKERYEKGDKIPEAHWDWVREFLYELFHVKPLYICAFYSNKGLTPWQAAAAWIEEKKIDSIQLRKGLEKGTYLKVYKREEILAHEAVHSARSGFNETVSEEFFAYMTSEKKWRRVLGPILRRPWEAWPFLLFCLAGSLWPVFYWGSALWAGIGFYRLISQHLRLKRAADHIYKKVKDFKRVRAILFRLTDQEIVQFSKNTVCISQFAKNQNCLRWRIIKSYLKGEMYPHG